MEWFDAWRNPPPKDGSWIMAVRSDVSGIEFLAWRDREWINADGEGNLFDDANFGLHYSVWSPAPSWMRMYCDQQDRDERDKEYTEKVRRQAP